jgi:hypothetical protein
MPVGALLPAGLGIADAVAGGLTSLGIGAETAAAAAPIITSTAGGAAFGAGESALFGGNPLTGAVTGGITSGVTTGVGPIVGSTLGIGTTAGEALTGAGVGAAASGIAGGNPLTGALTGAAGPLIGSALSPSTSTASGPMGTGTGAGTSGTPAAPGPAGGGVGSGGGGGGAPASPASAAPVSTVSGGSPPSSTDLTAAVANNPANTNTPTTPNLGGRVMDFLSNPFGMFGGGGSSVPAPTMATDTTPAGDFSPRADASGGGIGSTIGSWLSKNPGALLGGALLGGEMLFGNQSVPGLGAVQQTAGQEAALAGNLLQPLQTGQVPPGAQSMLDQLSTSMKSKVQSQYASLGLSGSTMEAQDLAKVDQTVAANKWNIINSLISTGTQELGASGTLDQASMNAQIQQDAKMQQAISTFAAALAGGGLRAAA